ncbi:MAG: hypothetical protein O8C64_06455 [Candidatus Methanoperedens sp.]|nr:hypothetical protein [Candidatus Methanoperedens sp.]MCZ7404633.1 hypothetical protein [Candidatus Methanoperedens sp.]
MLEKLKFFYTDPLYRNSLALMLNSAFGAFFGLLFRIVAAWGHEHGEAWDSSEVGRLDKREETMPGTRLLSRTGIC